MDFTDNQINRYSRHILLQELGMEGLEKLRRSKVLVVGVGGLGSANVFYLAAAGIGTIGIIDGDTVELSNLQRQIIHTTLDVDEPKVFSAKEKINRLNPDVEVITYQTRLDNENAVRIICDYDFIVDGTDNYSSKFLINDACVISGKPFSYGGVLRFEGQTMTHLPKTACCRCLFHSPPPPNTVPTSAQVGILGSVAGLLGTIQATETLKYLTGTGELLTNRLLSFDAKNMKFQILNVKRSKKCPVCGNR